jgi:hypothetical protein
MVMVLSRGMRRPGPQYLDDKVREVKYTRLGYGSRLSRLHTLGSPLAQAFLRGNHSATQTPEQENNHRTLYRSHVPQADPPATT